VIEYQELGNSIRERHQTMWQVRYISMLGITAFIAAYYLGMRDIVPKIQVFSFVTAFLSVWMLIEIRYVLARKKLIDRLADVEKEVGHLQYYSSLVPDTRKDICLRVIIYIAYIAGSILWIG